MTLKVEGAAAPSSTGRGRGRPRRQTLASLKARKMERKSNSNIEQNHSKNDDEIMKEHDKNEQQQIIDQE
jgi:hypothetical protein